MREIKFNFVYGIDGEADTYFTKTFDFGEIENGCHWDEIADSPLLREYAAEYIVCKRQYTGLKDKNGVEIYEGDIVDDSFKCGQLWLIVWNDLTAGFDKRQIKYDVMMKRWWQLSLATSPETTTGGLVIGNIHQNPELLEGGK